MALHLSTIEYMNIESIEESHRDIVHALENKSLKLAFDLLYSQVIRMGWFHLMDELNEVQNTYIHMLRYRLQGVEDPMQEKIYNRIVASIYFLADDLRRKCLMEKSEKAYYVERRALDTASVLLATLREELRKYKDLNPLMYEKTIHLLFDTVWTSDFLQAVDKEELQAILEENKGSLWVGCQLSSALTLGLMEVFDVEKLLFLFALTHSSDAEVKVRAVVGVVLTLYAYRQRIAVYPQVEEQLALLRDRADIASLLETISIRLIMAMETEKITEKMQNEIIPEMMKLNPRLNRKISMDDLSMESLSEDMNPEWKDKLAKSALEGKLMEMGELQKEGADLMHSSFIHLKSFPFFRDISNWFLPFSKGHTALSKHFGEGAPASALDKVADHSPLCNSDRYSLYLSLANFSQLNKLQDSMNAEASEMLKQENAEMKTRKTMEANIVGEYIQDLYRFFKLFAKRRDFQDIFAKDATYHRFHELPSLRLFFEESGCLLHIAEFYLHKGYYADALSIFEELPKEADEQSDVYQKMGYCHQMLQQMPAALEAYGLADILNPNSKWLQKHMALCYRSLKQPDKALAHYLRYEAMSPDNLNVALNIGHCHLELRNYAKALKYYFKVNYMKPNMKVWRAIAWCSFLDQRFEQASNYYEKILEDDPQANDFLNAGHTHWAMQNLKQAQKCYMKCVERSEGDFTAFEKLFRQDEADLVSAGIDAEELPLMLDELRYLREGTI